MWPPRSVIKAPLTLTNYASQITPAVQLHISNFSVLQRYYSTLLFLIRLVGMYVAHLQLAG
jgi:hypothetical protein